MDFFDLPAEIRNIIYDLALPKDQLFGRRYEPPQGPPPRRSPRNLPASAAPAVKTQAHLPWLSPESSSGFKTSARRGSAHVLRQQHHQDQRQVQPGSVLHALSATPNSIPRLIQAHQKPRITHNRRTQRSRTRGVHLQPRPESQNRHRVEGWRADWLDRCDGLWLPLLFVHIVVGFSWEARIFVQRHPANVERGEPGDQAGERSRFTHEAADGEEYQVLDLYEYLISDE